MEWHRQEDLPGLSSVLEIHFLHPGPRLTCSFYLSTFSQLSSIDTYHISNSNPFPICISELEGIQAGFAFVAKSFLFQVPPTQAKKKKRIPQGWWLCSFAHQPFLGWEMNGRREAKRPNVWKVGMKTPKSKPQLLQRLQLKNSSLSGFFPPRHQTDKLQKFKETA